LKNIKPDVLAALRGDLELMSLLGSITEQYLRIYAIKSPYALEFPRITFTQYANVGAGYSEDIRTDSNIYIILDFYCSGAPNSSIQDRADIVMTGLGFMREDGPDDLYEDLDDLQVYHTPIKYSIFETEV